MEELLKEILAELKQINSGVIISGNDLCALLEREKEVSAQRSRSIFNTVPVRGGVEVKKNAVPNLIRKIVDENFSKYVGKVNTPSKITIINDDIKNGGIARVIIESHDASRYDFKAGIAPVLRGYKDCKAMPCTSAKSK